MPTFKRPIKMSTALKIARRRVFSDGAQLLFVQDDGQIQSEAMCTDYHGTREAQVQRAVARARYQYAARLVYRSENLDLFK